MSTPIGKSYKVTAQGRDRLKDNMVKHSIGFVQIRTDDLFCPLCHRLKSNNDKVVRILIPGYPKFLLKVSHKNPMAWGRNPKCPLNWQVLEIRKDRITELIEKR